MPPTPKSESKSKTTQDAPDTGGLIEYIDMGDYTLEIDNRTDVQQRRRLPKSIRGTGINPSVRHELEERIELELRVPGQLAREEDEQFDNLLPPEEDYEAIKQREKEAGEALDRANRARDEQFEEQQEEVRSKREEQKGQK